MKVALVYDRVNKWGGAERLLLALHEIWSDAPLYTGVYNPDSATWAEVFKVKPSLVNKLPFTRTRHEFFAWLMPFGFENFSFDNYDVVISITSAEAKGIITKPKTLHICYCLTPTRYLWSNRKQYLNELPTIVRFFAKPAINHLRSWDKIASSRPDVYIAISHYVQDRIKRYYKRDADVIYPPINLDVKPTKLAKKAGDYFLVVSRLVKYKKVDLVIKACEKLGYKLVVVGDGKERDKLHKLAKSNTTFVEHATDHELAKYYEGCKALITAQEEDLGLVAAEGLLYGKPVITFNKGGVIEIVKDGVTGKFFNKQSVSALANALVEFNASSDASVYNSRIISQTAEKFSKLSFKHKFRQYVVSAYKNKINI